MLPEGEQKFREYINNLKTNPFTPRPDLNNTTFSKEFSPVVSIDETKQFNSKMELAEYLQNCFAGAGLNREDVLPQNGLWTWLAYVWFDQLAPITNPATAQRDIKRDDAKYICSSDYRDYYRHLVSGPYSIYSLHDGDNSNIFLYSRVNEHNDFIEQCASRQFIISHKNIVEAIHRLYFDFQRGQPKSGAQSRTKPGNMRRFVSVIQQFELTYDIYTMPADSILNLLPPEFDGWKT
jgi:hypothetical protein